MQNIKRYEVRFSGTGGQGVVLAGILFAEAASLMPGQYVAQTVSYGPQVRGGMSSAEVVVSQSPIDYPKPIGLDLLVPFTQEACNQALHLMKEDGVILLDPDQVPERPQGWVAAVPLSKIAAQSSGRTQMANVVALGVVAVMAPCVDVQSMERAIRERAPQDLEERFMRAFRAGVSAAEALADKIAYESPPSPEEF
jgi:2-oxoglutarate ferredoxin oxidoreductase subunit gamma